MNIKYSSIPAGARFLPGLSSASLRRMNREETDPKAAARLLAYAMRKEGKSMRQIGNALNRSYSTGVCCITRFDQSQDLEYAPAQCHYTATASCHLFHMAILNRISCTILSQFRECT